MGFFWTKDGHKYKHTSGPSSLTDEDQTQEARGVGRRRIYSLPLQFSARNIYRKYNRKRSCLGNTPKFIQTVYRISSKIMILLIFSHNCQALQRRKMSWSLQEDLGNLVLFQQVFIGRLLYARHCGIPNYTSSLATKERSVSEEHELTF